MKKQALLIAALLISFLSADTARGETLILASASYGKNIIAICDTKGKVIWSYKTLGGKGGHAGHHDVELLENGNILFHDSWTKTKEITLDGKVVWEYDSATANGNKGKRVDVHAFQRLANGNTMIVESNVGRIIEVDKDGKIQKEIQMKQSDRRHNTRQAHKLANGHYLTCSESPGVVTEYDADGKIIWEYMTKTRVYGATRLRSGNTLIATGSGNSIVEVTPKGEVVWEIKKTVPGTEIILKWTTCVTEMPNGNYVIGNCHAGDKNPQIFEITKDKKIVWKINRFDIFGNGLACSQVLNDKQSALVRKLISKKK
jgi:outer membrane protein assembly factor BamB